MGGVTYKMTRAATDEIVQRMRRDASNLPVHLQNLTLADIDTSVYSPDIWADYTGYLGRLREVGGRGLFLPGDPGQGKTLLAAVALNEARLRHRYWVRFETLPSLLGLHSAKWDAEKKASWGDEEAQDQYLAIDSILRRLAGEKVGNLPPFQFVVIDDVGKEYHKPGSGHAVAKFDELLRGRYNAGLATHITTNVKLPKWDEAYSPAMKSFINEACVPLPINTGQDYRTRTRDAGR